jgi:hypothetical protein
MGTSGYSKGPASGVSFDPSWIDDINLPGSGSPPVEQQNPSKQQPLNIIAPPGRFREAKTNLGNYVKSGDKDSLRRSLGYYSKKGMGGAKNVANRMRLSTAVGSGLFGMLQSVRDGTNQTFCDLFTKLKKEGADAYQFIDAIIDNVCPRGGSLDEDSCQRSVYSALSEFLNKNPDADIGKLSDDSLWSLTTIFLSNEAFNRIQLDIGQSFESKQISLKDRMTRLTDMREYIEAEISVQINNLRNRGENQSLKSLQIILNEAIENTFHVFEVEI